MTCTLSAASVNGIELNRLARELLYVRGSEWWNLPNLYKATLSTESWINANSNPYKGGIIFNFFSNPEAREFFTSGFNEGKAIVDSAIAEIEATLINLNRATGSVSFKPETIDRIRVNLTATLRRLKEATATTWFQSKYGGRSTTIPMHWFDSVNNWLLSTIGGVEGYSITPKELADLNFVAASIGKAGDDLIVYSDLLLNGDCIETDSNSDDDNCDRIADALEAIASKEFKCNADSFSCPALGDNPDIDFGALSEAVGVALFNEGITVPKDITNPPKGKPRDSDYKTIKSIPEFIGWQFEQLDALIGRFPIEIVQEDSDITTEGNQEKRIILPNISEALAELFALNAVQLTNSDALIQLSVDGIAETVLIKKMVIQCEAILNNIQEWTSIRIKQKNEKVAITVNPKARKLDEFLRSSEIDVVIDEYDPANDGSDFDIERIGKIVNTIYAIVSTALVHRLNKDDPSRTIRDDLNRMRDGMALIDDEDEDTFNNFLDRAEIGFTDTIINYNPDAVPKPYGRDRERRPLIRRTEGNGQDDIKD